MDFHQDFLVVLYLNVALSKTSFEGIFVVTNCV
jgi:hypothetical protein